MITKKKIIKKQEVKKSPQPKKEYKELPKKKELISDPNTCVSVCMTRDQIFRCKRKTTNEEDLQDLFERVLA